MELRAVTVTGHHFRFESGGQPAHEFTADDQRQEGRQALERILQGTDDGESLLSGDLEPLRSVAQRHAGQPFSQEVADNLVQAVLKLHFPQWLTNEEHFRAMSATIAESLMEDPHSLQRLRNFWDRAAGMT